jgi:transcriptional regulator with XRE-family HTH domain
MTCDDDEAAAGTAPERTETLHCRLGANVRRLRTAKGLSQEHLAVDAQALASRTVRSTIARVEKGEQDVRLSTLDAIAAALGVTPAELLDGAPAPAREQDVGRETLNRRRERVRAAPLSERHHEK